MDVNKAIFEAVLFEFDWGQGRQTNKVNDLKKFQLNPDDVKNYKPVDGAIALYINWYRAFSKADAQQLSLPDVVTYRSKMITAIQSQIQIELPDHPIMPIFRNHQRLLASQDSIAMPPPSSFDARELNFFHSCTYSRS